MILWTEQFATGSAKLDQQHRLLIDNINLLGEILLDPEPSQEELAFAVQLVQYLEAYANIHFQGEEQCMQSCRCAALRRNQQEHELFRAFIHDYRRHSEAEGFRPELLKKLHAAMKGWIEEHILKVDTQLRPHLLPATSPS